MIFYMDRGKVKHEKTLKILLVILILLQFLFLGLFGYAFVKKEDGEIENELRKKGYLLCD